ncbi:MAG: hypothetical protein KF800_10965 [Lysobacter sp.]|nr:hypothetical protein [Lysobacter sp.]
MNGSLNFFVRHGRFSAPHNPDCAKLRKPFAAVDGRRRSSEPPSMHRADGIARARTTRSMRAIDASQRRYPTSAGLDDDRRTAFRAPCILQPASGNEEAARVSADGFRMRRGSAR